MFPFVKPDGVRPFLVGCNFQTHQSLPDGQGVERGYQLVANSLISIIGPYVQFLNFTDWPGMVQQVLNVATDEPNDHPSPFGDEVMNHWIGQILLKNGSEAVVVQLSRFEVTQEFVNNSHVALVGGSNE